MSECASKFNCSKSTIRKFLNSLNIPIRTKSEANALAISSGKKEHPTKGKKLSKKTKEKIGEARSKVWENYSAEEYEKVLESYREQWSRRSDEQKERFYSEARKAMTDTAKFGSKLEKIIAEALEEAGFRVELHRSSVLNNQALEMDILLPAQNIVIEIDGPTHFFPIYGEDRLRKVKEADADKNGLLLKSDYVVIRIQHMSKNLSKYLSNFYSNEVVKQVKKVISNRPKKFEDRLIFIKKEKK